MLLRPRLFAICTCLFALSGCLDLGDPPVEPPPADVEPPVVRVVSPNGGEVWEIGSSHSIEWTATDPDTPATQLRAGIEWSADGAANWIAISANQVGSGAYSWMVPNGETTQARVRVTVSDGARSGEDASDGFFSVIRPPSGGDNVLAIGSASGATGGEVTVSVLLSNPDVAVGALEGGVAFDSSVARFVALRAVGRAIALELNVGGEPGLITLALSGEAASDSVAAGSGAVLEIDFELIGQGGEETPLTPVDFELRDPRGRVLDRSVVAGNLRVDASGPAPEITALVPGRTVVGDTLLIEGRNFGSTSGRVLFTSEASQTPAQIVDWEETRIRALVPDAATDGPVRVEALGQESEPVVFSVAPRRVTLTQDLHPLFQRKGCEACHFGSGGSGGFSVITHADLLRGGGLSRGTAVIPRRSGSSVMVLKVLTPPPFGDRMPQGSPPLTEAEVRLFEDWIDQGARND